MCFLWLGDLRVSIGIRESFIVIGIRMSITMYLYNCRMRLRKAFLQKNKFCTGGSELWFATQFHVSHPSINTLQHAITLEVEHRVAVVVGKARQVADRYSSNLIAQFAFIEIIRANKL